MSKVAKEKKKLAPQQQSTVPPTENANTPRLFSDTICSLDVGSVSWESIYKDVANSFLHRIVAQPKILPYTDMVRWVVDKFRNIERNIVTQKHTIIGLFIGKDLNTMYHFSKPQCKYKNSLRRNS